MTAATDAELKAIAERIPLPGEGDSRSGSSTEEGREELRDALSERLDVDLAHLDLTNPLDWAEVVALKGRVTRESVDRLIRAMDAAPPPSFMRLDELLARPLTAPKYRIHQLWPAKGRVLVAAQSKSGKSTMMGNLTRSLVDGDRFLDRFDVTPVTGTVALLDNELDKDMLQRWLEDQGICNTDRVHLLELRGAVSSFDILDARNRRWWADQLRELDTEVIILDCLRPLLDAYGLDESKDAGRLLGPFDQLLRESGASEACVVHHMGHLGERSRGDSRLRDWPDAEWKIVRDQEQGEDDRNAPRFFSAYGRDVNIPEQHLAHDEPTRRLRLTGGNRREEKLKGDALSVVALLQMRGGDNLSQGQIMRALEWGDKRVKKAVSKAQRESWLVVDDSTNTLLHRLTEQGRKV